MTLRLPAAVLRAELGGDEVLLNTETGMYHLVNATGREVLAAFADGLEVDGAIERISDRSGEPAERVRVDVEVFVRAMLDRGLLEIAPPIPGVAGSA